MNRLFVTWRNTWVEEALLDNIEAEGKVLFVRNN